MTDGHELYKEIQGLICTYLYPLSVTSYYAHPFPLLEKLLLDYWSDPVQLTAGV